jgi:hypothetical protein
MLSHIDFRRILTKYAKNSLAIPTVLVIIIFGNFGSLDEMLIGNGCSVSTSKVA